MKIVLHLPDSIQLSYLSTDNSYRFELKGLVNSSVKNGCVTGNTNKNSIQESAQTILEKSLPVINGVKASGNFKDDINHFQADRNDDVKDSGSLLYTESTYENEETILINTAEKNGETNDVKSTNDCSGDYHQKTKKGDNRCLNENNVPEIIATHAQRARRYYVNRGINTVTVNHRDGNGIKNNDDEHGNEHNFKTAEQNSAVHFNDSLLKPTETYSDTCKPRPVRPSYRDTRHTTFSIHSVERRKIKTSRIKTVKNPDREGKIRRYAGEYFSSKQAQVEPHVLWPSMHPLLPYRERRLEKR